MVSEINPPFLIVEAGLHGDGDAEYYLLMIKALRAVWSGWPRIVFKLQYYNSNSPWLERVREMHGRDPLGQVTMSQLVTIGDAAREAGFGYAVTFHDISGVELASGIKPLTHIKLGSFDFAQPVLRNRAVGICSVRSLGLVASVFGVSPMTLEGILKSERFPEDTVFLLGEAKYPSNKLMGECELISAYTRGYSAHNVPSLARSYVVDALHRGAKVIELHVTMRPFGQRPLPGDMCVSLDIDQFMKIARRFGEAWAN